jgi:periplasmic divalent cation tolerance protein
MIIQQHVPIWNNKMATGSEFCAVYVTCGSQDEARAIAGALVEEKLAACVNIIPGVQSIYYWENAVQNDVELILMIKTRSELLDALTTRVKALHSYDVCEIIASPIFPGNPDYFTFLRDNTRNS